jgi:hypothetical protein
MICSWFLPALAGASWRLRELVCRSVESVRFPMSSPRLMLSTASTRMGSARVTHELQQPVAETLAVDGSKPVNETPMAASSIGRASSVTTDLEAVSNFRAVQRRN